MSRIPETAAVVSGAISNMARELSDAFARLAEPEMARDFVDALVAEDDKRLDQLLLGFDELPNILPYLNRKWWVPDFAKMTLCITEAVKVWYVLPLDKQDPEARANSFFCKINYGRGATSRQVEVWQDYNMTISIGVKTVLEPGDYFDCLNASGLVGVGYIPVQACNDLMVPNGKGFEVNWPPIFPPRP